MIDVDVDGLVAPFLARNRKIVIECSKGVVGKCVVAGNEMGDAAITRSTLAPASP